MRISSPRSTAPGSRKVVKPPAHIKNTWYNSNAWQIMMDDIAGGVNLPVQGPEVHVHHVPQSSLGVAELVHAECVGSIVMRSLATLDRTCDARRK